MRYCGTPETANFVPQFFPNACKKHDACYENLMMTQEHCDILFVPDMWNEAPQYFLFIPIFFLAVFFLGSRAKRSSEKNNANTLKSAKIEV